jgi:hypothetical protein
MEIITGLFTTRHLNKQSDCGGTAHADYWQRPYQWFEAGEALWICSIPSGSNSVAKLMKAYRLNDAWARQCAISALAMRGDEKTRHSPWKQLALVGRDIASDLPLDQIPLMKQVAEISVRAFERRA